MDTLSKKTHQTSRSFTYTYYVSPADPGKPTLLLIHGCPDTALIWADLATTHLQPLGYGIIAANGLGYAESSQPADTAAYAIDAMVQDLCEILSAEHIDQVITLGHDWGSMLAQRMYTYHPERVLDVVTIGVAYIPPMDQPMDFENINDMMRQHIRYEPQEYFHLFTSDEGPAILDAHLESFFTALHGEPDTWIDLLGQWDGLKNFLLQDQKQAVLPYATDEMREAFCKRLERDGCASFLQWYKGLV